MGYALDWVSVKGLGHGEVLSRLGLADAGVSTCWPDSTGFMWATTPQGRVVVVAGRLGWLKPKRLAHLSIGVEAVACSADDNECGAVAWGYSDGVQLWSVIHDQAGHGGDLTHMETVGDVPGAFAAIHAHHLRELEDDDVGRVSYLFDAPQDLAGLLGGWRPESNEYDDLEFFEAEVAYKPARRRTSRFLDRFFRGKP